MIVTLLKLTSVNSTLIIANSNTMLQKLPFRSVSRCPASKILGAMDPMLETSPKLVDLTKIEENERILEEFLHPMV